MKRSAAEIATLSGLIDAALDLPLEERSTWIEQLPSAHDTLKPALRRLLTVQPASDSDDTLGDVSRQVQAAIAGAAGATEALEFKEGARVGPYELMRELGRGGMGTVWLARRTEGLTRRVVALKLPHPGLLHGEFAARMARERDILESLAHPNIARLHDAGMTPAGQPYLALEYIEGVPITAYCDQKRLGLPERIRLFAQVLQAIQYAHSHLVIHRDLKPANILVTEAGAAVVLDFGIAKLTVEGTTADTALTQFGGRALTPDFASPEQIAGQPLTTASDVYSLGVILYELLTGERPYKLTRGSAAALEEAILAADVRRPSQATHDEAKAEARAASMRKLARTLRGDLDTIVLTAMRVSLAERYRTVDAFALDIGLYLENRAIHARPEGWWEASRRFVKRHKVAVSAAALVVLMLTAGIAATSWQARRAQIEATRATAIKDFLISIFRASDPRIASDKPRGEITARQLLDIGSERIEKEFSGQPELQIELLGLTAAIYGNLNDEGRYAITQKRRIEIARAHYGPTHPIVIEGLISEADAACLRLDYAKANRLLDETDALLKSSGQSQSLLRANWWRTKARALSAVNAVERSHALDAALALYAKLAPHSDDYAAALNMASRDLTERGEDARARQVLEQALAIAEASADRNDSLIAAMLSNLGRKQERLGEFVAADNTYERADDLMRKTHGENDATYWAARARHAQMLHQRGQRERANAMFAQMLRQIPQRWQTNTYDTWAREMYAECLVAEGRAHDAIPLLEAAYQVYQKRPQDEYDVREARRKLGDAYDRVGRAADARTLLKASRDEYIAKEGPASQWTLRVRERWGRFLLDHSKPDDVDFTTAETEFTEVLKHVSGRPLLEAALAHTGLARILAARDDAEGARKESNLALANLERVRGLYDLRVQSELWLVHSAVLLKTGDRPDALKWAEKALAASRSYDDPSSPAIAHARDAVRIATTVE
ncbi:MAG: serine/threonine-protein kinase [Pseudomonadota bacterium]